MKFVKGIGLFFIYPLTMLTVGFYVGIQYMRYFYPEMSDRQESYGIRAEAAPSPGAGTAGPAGDGVQGDTGGAPEGNGRAESGQPEEEDPDPLQVSSDSETLYVGTEYVLEENDVLRHTTVETVWELPDKYVGMNREQFLAAMDTYAMSPPLKELERGFVGLEVISFARERVVVQMNYRYVQPSSSFYLAVFDNRVLVYLEDQSTVYIETNISLDSLPREVQQEIIQMMWVENEEALYNFLETYSS